MITARLARVRAVPPRDAPIVFARRVPTGLHLADGLPVQVLLRPDLRIVVMLVQDQRVGLTGRFTMGRVVWDQAASAALPATAMVMIAADISDALFLFQRGLVDPRAWTSIPEAQLHLSRCERLT